MADFILRPAEPADAEAICGMHMDSIRRLDGPFYSAGQIEAWAGSKRPEQYVETMALDGERMLVALSQGRIVGYGSIFNAEIRGLYVSPDHVHQGVGRGLCRAMEDWALSQGTPAVHLLSSLQAEGFYLRMGFRRIEAVRFMLSAGVPLEAVRMEKYLKRP
jgi:predicted N-acetyltransferase YhbS